MDVNQIDPFEPAPPRPAPAPLPPQSLASIPEVESAPSPQEILSSVYDDIALEPSTIINEPAAVPVATRSEEAGIRDETRMQRLRRYQLQESIRAPKVQIDQKLTLWAWIIGILVAFVASAIVSFNGITAVAEFVGLSAPWMGSLFFFFIELMYLLFLIAYLLLSSRVDENDKKERTFGAVLGMVAFGGVAVLANGFHTVDFWDYDFTEPRLWAGTILGISAPLAIISASKMASRVVFARSITIEKE
jgi:hypothetical protein